MDKIKFKGTADPTTNKRIRTDEQKKSSARTRKKHKIETSSDRLRTSITRNSELIRQEKSRASRKPKDSDDIRYIDFRSCSYRCKYCKALHFLDEHLAYS